MSIVESSTVSIDSEETERAKNDRMMKIARWTLPSLVMVVSILAWHLYVTLAEVPHYILPGPLLVAEKLAADWSILWPATIVTARLTLLALTMAVIGGVALAVAFTQSKWAEMSFFPYAVILQVTPVIAVAPLPPILWVRATVGART